MPILMTIGAGLVYALTIMFYGACLLIGFRAGGAFVDKLGQWSGWNTRLARKVSRKYMEPERAAAATFAGGPKVAPAS